MQDSENLQNWLQKYIIPTELAGTVQKCQICEQEFTVRKSGLPPKYGICKKCKCSFTSKNRVVTEDQKQQQKEKALNTWQSKSEEDKKAIIAKRKTSLELTCANRSVEDKLRIGKKISETQQSFSDEQKLLIAQKKSESQKKAWAEMSQDKKESIKLKNIESHNTEDYKLYRKQLLDNLTSDQKLARSQKSRETAKHTWENKREEILGKIQASKACWTTERKQQIIAKQKDTWKKRSQEERQRSLEKFRQTWKNKSADEKRDIRSKAVHRYMYDGELFDSSWELALWIYAKDHGEDIKRCPTVLMWSFNDQNHEYYPDFEYNGQLVEIKGEQFFKENGDLYCPYDRSLDEYMKAKQAFMNKIGVKLYRLEDIEPVYSYILDTYKKHYLELFNKKLYFPYPELPSKSNDFDLIRYFHKSIYKANRHGYKSPYEAWQDKDLIKKSALNRLKYVGRCTPKDVLQGFNVAKIAPKVSVFKPTLATELIQKYLSDADIIVDPFSGFSGRMLGAFNSKKQYIGFDLNTDHVRESNEIINYKKIDDICSVEVQDLISVPVKDWSYLKDVCLFTCPPYSNKESWSENEVTMSCDEWIDLCLEKHKGCKKYLFVVDETEKYKDYIVQDLKNKSHLGENTEKVVLIA